MPHRYLDDITTADAAFRAWGTTMEEMFVAAAEATMGVMVQDLDSIARRQQQTISVHDGTLEMLLFQFLQELIFYKDARQLLLRATDVAIRDQERGFTLRAQAQGEQIDSSRHELIVDVKAVTLYRFSVAQVQGQWQATVVLDV